MEKQEHIKNIIGLMNRLVLSAQAHNPNPWLHLGLTMEQLRVIFLLSCKGRSSPGEVAESLGVPKANVTSVIDRLVDKGLVRRQENPDDRRRHILSLTEEGTGQVERLREIRANMIERVLERMPDQALASLRTGLEALIEALKEEGEVDGHNRSQ